jgi:hypothetical protein
VSDRVTATHADVAAALSPELIADEIARHEPIDPHVPRVLPPAWRRVFHPDFDPELQGLFQHTRAPLTVIATVKRERGDGRRWLHVSVSHARRLPTWEDVREVKDLFIGRERRAIQVLPPESEYVNVHPRTLHLWHCLDGDGLPDFRVAGVIV